jgi:hypothetical protein
MKPDASPLTDSFNSARRRNRDFGEQHRTQLDALGALAEEITAEGTFRAELKNLTNITPTLEIAHQKEGFSQTFFIDFGFAPFAGSVTIALSTGLQRAPISDKKEGYDMRYDAKALLKAIGETMAKREESWKNGAAAVKHIATRQP